MPGSTQVPGERCFVFVYRAVTFFGRLSHTFLLTKHFLTLMFQALQPRLSKLSQFGLFPFRSPLLRESFLFLWVLRCFSSPGSLHASYIFRCGYCWFATVGFPIRTSPDQYLFTAPRSLSQCPTSFIGIWRQGIHRKPLVASVVIRRTRPSLVLLRFMTWPTLKNIDFQIDSISIQFLRFCHETRWFRRAVF